MYLSNCSVVLVYWALCAVQITLHNSFFPCKKDQDQDFLLNSWKGKSISPRKVEKKNEGFQGHWQKQMIGFLFILFTSIYNNFHLLWLPFVDRDNYDCHL